MMAFNSSKTIISLSYTHQIIMSKMLLPTLNLVLLLLPALCTCQLKVMVITEPAQQDAFTAATEGIAKAQTDNGDTITIDIENVKVYFLGFFYILFIMLYCFYISRSTEMTTRPI